MTGNCCKFVKRYGTSLPIHPLQPTRHERSEIGSRRVDSDTKEVINQSTDQSPNFQVFLSYNSKDRKAVIDLKKQLENAGLKCWFDHDELIPGQEWQIGLEKGILSSDSFAAFFGSSGIGAWKSQEMQLGLTLAVRQNKRIIPVILPNAPAGEPELPLFLNNRTWVDFRGGVTKESLDRLICGITGQKPKLVNDPVKIFICYAHEDERFREVLDKCFTSLKRDGVVDVWHDRRIELGEDWEAAIKEALNQCKLGVLLISNDFLDSNFIHLTELPELLKRRGEGLKLIPILVRPSTFKTNPILNKLQVIPDPTRTVIEYPENTGERDRVWLDIFEKIRQQVEKMRNL